MSGMFRFLTAGESHGEALVAVIDDLATKEAVEAVVERSDVCAVRRRASWAKR